MYHEYLPWEGDLGVRTNKEMRPNNLEIEPNRCSQFHSESHCKKKKNIVFAKWHLNYWISFSKICTYITYLEKNQSIKHKLSPKSHTIVRKHGKAQWPCCKQIF